jgi:hypothetical protein
MMAVNSQRSMRRDLLEGATDGSLKKRAGNGQRGGVVDPANDWAHDQAVIAGSHGGAPVIPPNGEPYEYEYMEGVIR